MAAGQPRVAAASEIPGSIALIACRTVSTKYLRRSPTLFSSRANKKYLVVRMQAPISWDRAPALPSPAPAGAPRSRAPSALQPPRQAREHPRSDLRDTSRRRNCKHQRRRDAVGPGTPTASRPVAAWNATLRPASVPRTPRCSPNKRQPRAARDPAVNADAIARGAVICLVLAEHGTERYQAGHRRSAVSDIGDDPHRKRRVDRQHLLGIDTDLALTGHNWPVDLVVVLPGFQLGDVGDLIRLVLDRQVLGPSDDRARRDPRVDLDRDT